MSNHVFTSEVSDRAYHVAHNGNNLQARLYEELVHEGLTINKKGSTRNHITGSQRAIQSINTSVSGQYDLNKDYKSI